MAPFLRGTRFPLLLPNEIKYFLRDEFTTALTAGSINGTTAEPGPGVRIVRDVEGKITSDAGWLNFGAQASAVYAEEDLVFTTPVITRTPGQIVICKWKCAIDGPQYPLALVTSTTPAWNHTNVEAAFWRSGAIVLSIVNNATVGPVVTGFVADETEYLLAIAPQAIGAKYYIKGGVYIYWTKLYESTTGNTDTLYLAVAGNTAVFSVDRIKNPTSFYNPMISNANIPTNWLNPYIGGTPYKGQLHCHTTNSDGVDSPADLVTAYKNVPYDFVSITDHNYLTPDPSVGGILFIPGEEEGIAIGHIVNFDAINSNHYNTAQESINHIIADSSLALMAHPKFATSNWTLVELQLLYDYKLLAVYNYHVDEYSEDRWDEVLSWGRLVWGYAEDDCHDILTELNGGFVVVFALSLTAANIKASLAAGNFYASQGPTISAVTLSGRTLSITTPESSTIEFIKKNGVIAQTNTAAMAASYEINDDDLYVRAVVTRTSDGKKAWANPIWLPGSGELLYGAELLNDTSLEDTYTAGKCNTLAFAGSPVCAESADAFTGNKAQEFTATAYSDRCRWGYKTATVGTWYRFELRTKRTAGNSGTLATQFHWDDDYKVTYYVTSVDYITKKAACRYRAGNGNITIWPFRELGTGPFDTGLADEGSIKPVTLASMFSKPFVDIDPYVECELTIADGFQGGVGLNIDSLVNPQNFILPYYDRVDGKVYLTKCLSGVYTDILGVSATYVAGAKLVVRKTGLIYYVWYNDVLIGTWTADAVTDAAIINNTTYAKFRSGDETEVYLKINYSPTGNVGNDHAILDKF